MLQATVCDGGTLDVLTFGDDGVGPAEVDVGRGEVIDAFVIAGVIVVFNEGPYLPFEIARQVVVVE